MALGRLRGNPQGPVKILALAQDEIHSSPRAENKDAADSSKPWMSYTAATSND